MMDDDTSISLIIHTHRVAHRIMSLGGGEPSVVGGVHQEYDLILHNDLLSNGHVQW